MSFVLIISIVLPLAAAIWTIVLWRRNRDWRFMFLAVVFAALAVVPGEELIRRFVADRWGSVASERSISLSQLFVSALTLLFAFALSQASGSFRSDLGPKSPKPTSGLARIAMGIAVIAIFCSVTTGWLAYTSSRQTIIDSIAKESLAISQTIITNVQHELDQGDEDDVQQRAVEQLKAAWERTTPPYPGSYLCVIDKSGRLALHTAKPEMRGADVSGVIVDPKSPRPRSVAGVLAAKESLATQNVNFRGHSQIVGYAYMPSIDSLVVTHVPAKLVEENIRNTAIPWAIAMALIGGLLVPLSVGLIHHGYTKAQRIAQRASHALQEQERQLRERYSELELIYRAAPVGLCLMDTDLRFIRINDEMAILPIERYIGKSLREVSPDMSDMIEPILRRVLETGVPTINFELDRPSTDNLDEQRYYLLSAHPVVDNDQQLIGISVVAQNITERREAERGLELENELLAAAAHGMPLDEALRGLVAFIESQAGDLIASVLLVDPNGLNLRYGAAPGLSSTFNEAVKGTFLGQDVESGATAAIGRQPVFVEDIQRDPAWAPYKELADAEGVRACWSVPIENVQGLVLGTLAIYRREPGSPTARHCKLMDTAKHLASLLLTHDHRERELRDSEARFRTIFEQVAVGVAQLDALSETFLRTNPRYCEIVGLPRESILGHHWEDRFHPDDVAVGRANMERLRAGAIREFNLEKRLRHDDGSYVWINLSVAPMWQPGEEPSTYIAIAEDITKRKRAIEQLRDSQVRYADLYENAPDMMASIDPATGTVVQCNQTLARVTGRPKDEIVGKPFHDILNTDQEVVSRILAKLASSGRVDGEQLTLLRADGSKREIVLNATSVQDADGKRLLSRSVLRDVTDQKKAESELAESEARLRAIFDSEPECVKLLSPKGELLDMNPAGLALIEADTLEQVAGQSIFPIITEEHREAFQTMHKKVLKGEVAQLEFQLEGLKGSRRWMDTHATPLRDSQGKIVAHLAVTRDVTERKLAEKQLRFTKFSVDRCSTAVFWIQRDASFFYVNDSVSENFGYTPAELMSMTVHDINPKIPAEDWPKLWERIRRQKSLTFESQIRRKDSDLAEVEITTNLLRFEGEEFVFAFVTDITQRKQTQTKLKESEALFRGLVNTAPFGIQRNDCDGKITFANAAHAQIYGCKPDQLIGRYIWDLAVDESSKSQMKEIVTHQVHVPVTVPESYQTKNRRFDGRTIDINIDWTYDLDPAGVVVGFIVIVTDITQRKEAERNLAFQADVLNRVSDAVLVTDDRGCITYANEAAERLRRDSSRNEIGRELSELHDELLASGPRSDAVRESLQQTGVWHGESEFQIGGETRSFETKLKTFHSPGSDERFLLSVMRDISNRKQAEQERRQHREILAHVTRLSTMGELVTGIAHEVKQPLYAITNFSTATAVTLQNINQREPIADGLLSELINWNGGVRDASKRAGEIIQRLREFARKGEGRRETIDLERVVRDSIELVAFEARQNKVTVETELADDLPEIVADRIQCEQILVNLLHNACEALCDHELPRRIVVRTQRSARGVEFQIVDNGPGIPANQHGKLFEAFYTTKPRGMGMGLAISRTIVEDHQGRIWGSVNEHGGATFHFTLPCRIEATIVS